MLVSTIAYGNLRDESRRDIERAHVREARAGRTSFWRRELHLFPRRTKEATIARAQTEASSTDASSSPAEPKVPWYKREIGPSKKAKAAKQQAKAAKREAEAAAKQQAKADKEQAKADEEHAKAEKKRAKAERKQGAVLESEEPKVPWYKREIGRKKRSEPAEVVEASHDLQPDEPSPLERILAATESTATWYPTGGQTSEPAQAVEPETNAADAWSAFFGDAVVTDDAPTLHGVEPESTLPAPDAPLDAVSTVDSPRQADELDVDDSHEALAATPKVPWYKREIGPSKGAKTAKKESRAVARQARVDAKQQAKDDKERAKIEKKQAVADERQAKVDAKQQAKDDKGRAKIEKKQAEAAVRDAKAAAKQQAKADRERAKAEKKQAKVPWYKRELGRPKRSSQGRDARKQRTRRGGGRKQRIVGLKIGGSQLAAARIANNGSAELVQLARADLQRGVVVGGELRDPESLTTALKKFFRDNKLPRQGVRLGIGSNRIGVRVFEIAGVEDRSLLDNAVRFKAQEFLPIPIEQAVLDYHVVDERVDEDGRLVHRVLVAFAYRELVDRYVEACRRAGIRLSGIDLEAFALLRALGAPEPAGAPQRDAAVIAVAIGHDRSTLAVSDGRICEFTRILEWGGFQLDVAVSRVLDVTPSEAEGVKREVDLSLTDVVIGDLTAERSQEVREAVRKQVELLARELVSSLQFYQSQPGSLGVGEIVVTGGTAQLRGLDAELQRLIGVKVRLGDPYARVKVGRRVKAAQQLPSLAVAIGLGIED